MLRCDACGKENVAVRDVFTFKACGCASCLKLVLAWVAAERALDVEEVDLDDEGTAL